MTSTSTYQQSLADAGFVTRPLMLKRGSYVPLSSLRYIEQKWETRKFLKHSIEKAIVPYEGIVNASRAKRVAKTHDPLALVANTYASSSSSQSPIAYYVTHPPYMVEYDDDYQGDAVCDDQEDSLTTTMILIARAIAQCYSTPINNHLRTDEVFSIWKAFGGNTRDLGSFGEETDKTMNLHQYILSLCSQRLETTSQDTRDDITFHPTTASQDLAMAS
ncbi:hypothetical protein Tco_0316575 [Tanacetum coccineum]